ncbi:MAG TPA: hypothetical protein VMD91_10600 [Candidatus Sulfotelmatobacter sp.]|nr:hypothetical protein [Candidatus Sulfotelmatobacter sp.]
MPPRKKPGGPKRPPKPPKSVTHSQKVPLCGAASFTDYFGLDKAAFSKIGAFDLIVNRDTKLMIDPKLLATTSAPELKGARAKLLRRYRQIFKLLASSQFRGDEFDRAAYRLTDFPEFRGVGLGYARESVDGSGWADTIRSQVLETARAVVQAGLRDPEFFELLALFERNIGADRISDMIGTIIRDDLVSYTQRVCGQLGVGMKSFPLDKSGTTYAELPWYMNEDAQERYIILAPRDVLSALPVALDRSDISSVMSQNEGLRQHLNATIEGDWQAMVRDSKGKTLTRESFLEYPEVLRAFIERYRNAEAHVYDLEKDPEARKLWYEMARRYIEDGPPKLELPAEPSGDDLFNVVVKIVEQFKGMVENNRLRDALFVGDHPRREKVVQSVFHAIARVHCGYNDLDVSAETDGGRGPVDFKLSHGAAFATLVELKLSDNSRLAHGYSVQLQEYKKAECTARAIYLVLNVGTGASARNIANLRKVMAEPWDGPKPTVIFVDGTRKPSASKTPHPKPPPKGGRHTAPLRVPGVPGPTSTQTGSVE